MAEAHGEGLFREEVFTQRMVEILDEFGGVDDAATCHFQKRDMKVNAFSFGQDEQSVDLVVANCTWDSPPASFPKSEAAKVAKQGRNFLTESLKELHKGLEEASPAYDLAQRIFQIRGELTRARIIVICDGVAKEGILPDEEVGGIHVTYQVWDLERAWRCETSGGRRETIDISFKDFGGAIPCLSADDGTGLYTSYLAIVPGETLARIYETYGTRLLERNVRSFLQVRGNVNKGIRDTILTAPNMFLTYNNGISVTAESVTLGKEGGSVVITGARDLQIVNGGQTTASLYNTRRKDKADLASVRIPMKLTVVHRTEAIEDMVSRISQYANTQNRVNMADFASNDPFHRLVEELSRTIWAPDPQGGKRQTRWFYERARGQYYDDKNRTGTPAQEKAFELTHPRQQVFTKTDLAKFENTWDQLPHLVSRGAQKNFAEFSIRLRKRDGFNPGPDYFQDLVAKAILFRQAEKIVSAQDFGGYRANIVTYTLALIAHVSGDRIDLTRIWEQQDLSPALRAEIERLSHVAQAHITKPPGGQNITEWCKKDECWTQLAGAGHKLSAELTAELVVLGAGAKKPPPSGIESHDEEDKEVVAKVVALGAPTWLEMSNWAKVTGNLETWQRRIVYAVGDRIRQGVAPSRRQAIQAWIAYEEAVRKGFKPTKGRDPTFTSPGRAV